MAPGTAECTTNGRGPSNGGGERERAEAEAEVERERQGNGINIASFSVRYQSYYTMMFTLPDVEQAGRGSGHRGARERRKNN